MGGSGPDYYSHKTSYEEIYNQTGPENTSVYIGNAPANCTGKYLLEFRGQASADQSYKKLQFFTDHKYANFENDNILFIVTNLAKLSL